MSAQSIRSQYDALMPVFLNEGWSERDPNLPRAIALNRAGFVTDYDLLTEQEIATNDVYCNFYRKHGIGYRAGTLIPMPSGDSIALVLPRHQDRGPVPREVVHALDGLRPHLARASLAANRLGFERAQAQVDALEGLGLPAAVLRGPGRVFAANAQFEALMPMLFQDRAERVAVTDLAADALLAGALGALAFAGDRAVKSIPVAATAAHVPMVVHRDSRARIGAGCLTQASALLVVTPVDRAAVPTAEVLQGLFDLTPAEARVARAIAQAETRSTRWPTPAASTGKRCAASSRRCCRKPACRGSRNWSACLPARRSGAAEAEALGPWKASPGFPRPE